MQQLKSNERRSNNNKRKTSDVGSKDDEIVTQEVIRLPMGETLGLRRRVREKKKLSIAYFIKTVVEKLRAADAAADPPIFLNCCR